MKQMLMGEAPEFGKIIDRLTVLEAEINRRI